MSDQKRQRRSYTPQYRIEAANLVIDTGRSIAAVAKEIGVGEQTLGTWVKAEKDRRRVDGESTGPLNEDERAELARLRRENFDLKQDNEFLGKAALDSNRQGNTSGFRVVRSCWASSGVRKLKHFRGRVLSS
ncbi:Transposase and inactivated derivatives [Brevibacterium antiquum CNRZ 918]|uniref:Transposase and inactivated derivatives n=1 Tax=Brevibacterium antiquum CNRZ 918 TaxID=1255637 RepID=A0A2H1K4L9_9MICO|nr:Transposase and inactivated derivatives [Brevibacterium antiquum CNRZ 918]